MGPVNLMESLYFSKMVPNYRLSKVFLSCYHIFSDYSMPLQKKKKTNKDTNRHGERENERDIHLGVQISQSFSRNVGDLWKILH